VQTYLFSPELFPSSAAAFVFSIVYLLWPVSEIIGGGIIPLFTPRRSPNEEERPRLLLLIFISIVVSLSVAFSFASAGIAMLPSWAFYPGIVLMVEA